MMLIIIKREIKSHKEREIIILLVIIKKKMYIFI